MRAKQTTKVGVTASALVSIIVGLSSGALAPTAAAAPLLSADVSLPLGTLGQPVANLINPITQSLPTPVTLQSNPASLNANLATPILSNPVDVNVSLPPVVQPILNPPTNPAPGQPVAPSAATPSGSDDLTVLVNPPTPQVSVTSESHVTESSGPASPLEGFASFFTSTLPDVLHRLASAIAGKEVDPFPIALSAIVFLITMAAVGAIVYTTNYGDTLVIGQRNLTKFAKAHDINQMAALIVTTVCLGVVAIFLTLSSL